MLAMDCLAKTDKQKVNNLNLFFNLFSKTLLTLQEKEIDHLIENRRWNSLLGFVILISLFIW